VELSEFYAFLYAVLSPVRAALPFSDHGKCATGMMKKLSKKHDQRMFDRSG
jgi:hypothetical protein